LTPGINTLRLIPGAFLAWRYGSAFNVLHFPHHEARPEELANAESLASHAAEAGQNSVAAISALEELGSDFVVFGPSHGDSPEACLWNTISNKLNIIWT
jgi:hypothetical protein